jgi:hypothetical protein
MEAKSDAINDEPFTQPLQDELCAVFSFTRGHLAATFRAIFASLLEYIRPQAQHFNILSNHMIPLLATCLTTNSCVHVCFYSNGTAAAHIFHSLISDFCLLLSALMAHGDSDSQGPQCVCRQDYGKPMLSRGRIPTFNFTEDEPNDEVNQ